MGELEKDERPMQRDSLPASQPRDMWESSFENSTSAGSATVTPRKLRCFEGKFEV